MSRSLVRRTDLIKAKEHSLHAQFLEYLLIDGSGSMMSKWSDTMAGVTGYTDHLKSKHIRSWGIAHVFDSSNIADLQLDCELELWPARGEFNLAIPGGGTPLYDAINLMARDLAERDPQNCAITIVTDGDENGSRHTDGAQARALLDWCRAQNWQVTFLGVDWNNSKLSRDLGANESNSISVQKHLLLEAGKKLGEKRVNNIMTGNDIDFNKDEQQHFGGYLMGPSK